MSLTRRATSGAVDMRRHSLISLLGICRYRIELAKAAEVKIYKSNMDQG